MSWVKNHYHKWREQVVGHYGSLEAFPDQRTIQVLLRIAEQEDRDLCAFFETLAGRLADDPLVKQISDDHIATINAIHELTPCLERKLSDG